MAIVRRIQALHALRSGDAPAALALAEQAFELSRETPHEHGRSLIALAQARAAAGQEGADDAFERRSRCSAGTGRAASTPTRCCAYGRYLRDVGREHDALEVFERAAELAANLHGEARAERASDRRPDG